MRELDLIKQRLKLNIREYTKIIEKDNRSSGKFLIERTYR